MGAAIVLTKEQLNYLQHGGALLLRMEQDGLKLEPVATAPDRQKLVVTYNGILEYQYGESL